MNVVAMLGKNFACAIGILSIGAALVGLVDECNQKDERIKELEDEKSFYETAFEAVSALKANDL